MKVTIVYETDKKFPHDVLVKNLIGEAVAELMLGVYNGSLKSVSVNYSNKSLANSGSQENDGLETTENKGS